MSVERVLRILEIIPFPPQPRFQNPPLLLLALLFLLLLLVVDFILFGGNINGNVWT